MLLVSWNLTEMACNSQRRDRSAEFIVTNIALGVFGVVVVSARLIFKQGFSVTGRLGPDDWVIIAIILIGLPCIAINIFGLTAHGLGRDVWTLRPTEVSRFAFYFYVMEILYLTLVSLIKLSLSLFYLSIFPGRFVRRLLLGTIAFHVLFAVVIVFITIFQCSPTNYYWTKYSEDAYAGRCINANASGWTHASVNVAGDIWMIAIPLNQVRKLRLHWKKKIGAIIMFMTGIL